MTTPIDATTTSAWGELTARADGFTPDLRRWFADDPGRVERLTFDLADLRIDLSKNLVDDGILASLVKLADEVRSESREAVDALHAAGIRLMVDLVPNHSSNRHRWFRAALSGGPDAPERALYHVREGRGEHGEEPPNDWRSMFGGSIWERIDDVDDAGNVLEPARPPKAGKVVTNRDAETDAIVALSSLQVAALSTTLARLSGLVPVLACSGNHDLNSRNVVGSGFRVA